RGCCQDAQEWTDAVESERAFHCGSRTTAAGGPVGVGVQRGPLVVESAARVVRSRWNGVSFRRDERTRSWLRSGGDSLVRSSIESAAWSAVVAAGRARPGRPDLLGARDLDDLAVVDGDDDLAELEPGQRVADEVERIAFGSGHVVETSGSERDGV